jgi:hypothetical protein
MALTRRRRRFRATTQATMPTRTQSTDSGVCRCPYRQRRHSGLRHSIANFASITTIFLKSYGPSRARYQHPQRSANQRHQPRREDLLLLRLPRFQLFTPWRSMSRHAKRRVIHVSTETNTPSVRLLTARQRRSRTSASIHVPESVGKISLTPCITSEGAPTDSPVFHQPERAQYGLPASYTTSEGVTYKFPITRHYSSHLHRLLFRRSLYLGQWRHRYTNSIIRRTHTYAIYYLHRQHFPTRIRCCQLPPNLPHRPRQAIYPQHEHHFGRLRFPRRRLTL